MSEENRRGPGRPQINHEQMPARFPEGTFERIDGVLQHGEKRIDLIRSAVEKEVSFRSSRMQDLQGVDTGRRGPLAAATRLAEMVARLLADPRRDLLVDFPDATKDEIRTARNRVWEEIVSMWDRLALVKRGPYLPLAPSGNQLSEKAEKADTAEEKRYGLEAISRMEAARDFPNNTCPSSRHAQMCAEFLVRDGKYSLIEDEPAHVGGSIASTVAALYEARSFLRSLGYTWTVDEDGKSRWVRDEGEAVDE